MSVLLVLTLTLCWVEGFEKMLNHSHCTGWGYLNFKYLIYSQSHYIPWLEVFKCLYISITTLAGGI